jgi:hypothetical protein
MSAPLVMRLPPSASCAAAAEEEGGSAAAEEEEEACGFTAGATASHSQGLTLVHVRAQLGLLQDRFMT